MSYNESLLEHVRSLKFGNEVVDSRLWGHYTNIPSIPEHNNPGIYTALVIHLLAHHDHRWDYLPSIEEHCLLLEDKWTRWPSGLGGNISHDEILGWSYLSRRAACAYLGHLEHRFGFFPNEKGEFQWNRWMYRFVFLKPFLLNRINAPVPLIHKLLWSVYVLQSALRTKRDTFDADGVIKVWLMCRYPVVEWVANFWRRRINRTGLQPRDIFEVYLGDLDILKKIAPMRF